MSRLREKMTNTHILSRHILTRIETLPANKTGAKLHRPGSGQLVLISAVSRHKFKSQVVEGLICLTCGNSVQAAGCELISA